MPRIRGAILLAAACATFIATTVIENRAYAAGEAQRGDSEAVGALSPRAAGVRYGQAAGVALVCYGLKVTSASDALKARFEGEALAQFNEEAEKVLASWREMDQCTKSPGPNECRLAHEWSCRDAMREIGPGGSAVPGLVDVK